MKKYNYLALDSLYSSGGFTIGKKVAERLGIPYHNQDILEKSALSLGVELPKAKKAEETVASSVIYGLSLASNPDMFNDGRLPMADKLFIEEAKVIREYASTEDGFVVIGRCSDVILGNKSDCLRVFICAEMQDRINRATQEYSVKPIDVEKVIRRNDRRRTSFYEFNTSKKWGYRDNYHLILNSSALGIDGCVDIIVNLMQGNN